LINLCGGYLHLREHLLTIDAMRLRRPAIAMGFQSITFMNNPAMLQRNAVAAIARMPALLLRFSIQFPKSILSSFSGCYKVSDGDDLRNRHQ
jgi:hypothetical protein